MTNLVSSPRAPFGAALVTVLIGTVLLAFYVRRLKVELAGGAPVTLVALDRDLAAGTRLHEGLFVQHQVPETYVESRYVRASEIPKVLGVRTAIDLEANQTLSWTDLVSTTRDNRLLSDRISPGMRAVAVATSGWGAVGRLIRPGDRVDVFVTRDTDEARPVTIPLLQNVLLLSVGNSLNVREGGEASRATSVTLLVTVDQASLLIHAKRGGEVSLALRNADDLEISEGLPDTHDSDVLVMENRSRLQRRLVLERVN